MFCPHCGTPSNDNANFCHNCGGELSNRKELVSEKTNTNSLTASETKASARENQDKNRKCPQCGEQLESFHTHCPSCDCELRDVTTTNAIQEFSEKLDRIASEEMPVLQEEPSMLKKLFGTDFEKSDRFQEEKARFEKQKQERLISLIINFPIPNSKENLLEFILLAASHVETGYSSFDNDINKAWVKKLEQGYQKACISMRKDSDFELIESVYEEKRRALNRLRILPIAGIGALFIILIFMSYAKQIIALFSLLVIPLILIVTIGVGVYFTFKKR